MVVMTTTTLMTSNELTINYDHVDDKDNHDDDDDDDSDDSDNANRSSLLLKANSIWMIPHICIQCFPDVYMCSEVLSMNILISAAAGYIQCGGLVLFSTEGQQ